MARFVAEPDLNEKVAQMVAPFVYRIAKRVEREARRLAPPTKKWVHMGDGKVRDTHLAAGELPALPFNLRFAVPGQPWDVKHGLSPGVDYMLRPKDTSSGLPPDAVQNVHCRCVASINPVGIADKVHTGPVQVNGTEVRVVVSCEAYRIVDCEFGAVTPTDIEMPGTHFMRRAVARVAGNVAGYGPAPQSVPQRWGGTGNGSQNQGGNQGHG